MYFLYIGGCDSGLYFRNGWCGVLIFVRKFFGYFKYDWYYCWCGFWCVGGIRFFFGYGCLVEYWDCCFRSRRRFGGGCFCGGYC